MSSSGPVELRASPIVAVLVGAVCFVQTLVYSIPLPALPLYLLFREDGRPTLTQGQLGVVMGASTGMTVLMQPIIGRLLVSSVSDKTMICLGLTLNGLMTAASAALVFLKEKNQIFGYAAVCHALAAAGHSMSSIAIFAALGNHLAPISHIMLPLFEVILGVALVLGPFIGGPLYDVAGIAGVFLLTGGLCIILVPFVLLFYPGRRQGQTEDGTAKEPSTATYRILFSFPILLNIILVAHCYGMMTYNDVTLTNRLKKVLSDWPSDHSFAVLGTAGATLAGLSLLFGLLAKRVPDPRVFVLAALPIGAAAWLLISGVFSSTAKLSWMYFGQILLGLAMSPMFVCCYFSTLDCVGRPDDPGVYAIVSGALNPASNLGSSAGQLVSEFLRFPEDRNWLPGVGTDSAFILLNVLLTVVLAITMCVSRRS